jgi:hypothetical protein
VIQFIGGVVFFVYFNSSFFSFLRKRCQLSQEEVVQFETEINHDDINSSNDDKFGDIKNLPTAINNLLKNKIFMIVTLAFCFEITIISGFITFLPKYIEHQFSVNNSLANIYTGIVSYC